MYQVSPKLREQIYSRDGRICQYCGTSQAPYYEIDHIIPVSAGGIAALYNLVVACERCNGNKGSYVWQPRNLDSITVDHPEWQAKILGYANHAPGYELVRKRPGQPPGKQEKRTERVPIQLTPAEYEYLAGIAQKRHIPIAEIIRQDARAAGHLPAIPNS